MANNNWWIWTLGLFALLRDNTGKNQQCKGLGTIDTNEEIISPESNARELINIPFSVRRGGRFPMVVSIRNGEQRKGNYKDKAIFLSWNFGNGNFGDRVIKIMKGCLKPEQEHLYSIDYTIPQDLIIGNEYSIWIGSRRLENGIFRFGGAEFYKLLIIR